jgi:hypothetical protein
MYMKRMFCLTILLLFTATMTVSCASEPRPVTSAMSSSIAEPSDKETLSEGITADKASSEKSDLSVIVDSLKKEKDITEYAVSHDLREIAVIKMKTGGLFEFYVITVSNKKITEVTLPDDVFALHTIKWSYNDKYFSVEDGSSMQCGVYIFSFPTLEKRLSLGIAGNFLWANKSNTVVFAEVNKMVKEAVQTELDGAAEIKIYNIDTLTSRILINAKSQYYYNPAKCDEKGLLINKYNYTTEKTDTELFEIY